jgi:hypothetical protein
MSDNKNISAIISASLEAADKIIKIKEGQYNFQRGSKQNFNFFSAIVTGKQDKDHIEKYHSNFIAYLLNPDASHDCGVIFLKYFLEVLKKRTTKDFVGFQATENKLTEVTVEREMPVNNGSIDIAIKYKKDWLMFIENKVESEEGYQQVKCYCDWAKKEYPNNWCGVYLTKVREVLKV